MLVGQLLQYGMISVLAYLVGSIPVGYLVVKVARGVDIRHVGSGRTGGTNALRAAGLWAGVATGVGDALKGAGAVLMARWLAIEAGLDSVALAQMLAGVAAVVGHNWSIFLSFHGGAGTGPNVGAAAGLWLPVALVLVPVVPLVLVVTGYASVTSMTVALLIPLIFAIRALVAHAPWEYALYGTMTALVIFWALRPNIARLKAGTERVVGPRARRLKARMQEGRRTGHGSRQSA